jgi:ceramide glucosyltransferase
MYSFYFFAAILICLGIQSLRSGIRYSRYVRRAMSRPLANFTPFASIITPCRGLDQGLRENITGLFNQHYPAYEIIFVTDDEEDPSLTVIEDIKRSSSHTRNIHMQVVIAGKALDSGQKVHNLRAAVKQVDPSSEVLIFVDTDARPDRDWLRSLVAPLQDERTGAATGYRWFVPVNGGFASQLRSVWNASIASALGEREDKNFCWGGSTAIPRETFEKLKVRDRWRGTVSDDFTLTRVLQEANFAIHFVPACLTASLEDCSFRELLEFTTRQLKITRAYASHLWKAVLMGSVLFTAVFFGGIALLLERAIMGLSVVWPASVLLTIFILGAAKAYIRFRAVAIPLDNYKTQLSRSLAAHLLLWPLAQVLYLYNALAAAFSRQIEWRGIKYELKSSTETVIIARSNGEGIICDTSSTYSRHS